MLSAIEKLGGFRKGGGRETPTNAFRYDGFISYSHSEQQEVLAAKLQRALHRFAKPWWALRAIRLFRDETNLSANPELWASITTALDQSRHLLLMASPQAARSKWVHNELEYWLDRRGTSEIIIVLTDGDIVWDSARNAFDPDATTALPRTLLQRFRTEPKYVKLTCVGHQTVAGTPINPELQDAVATIASEIRGIEKDTLFGADVAERRKALRIAWSAVAIIGVLAVAAISLSIGIWNALMASESRRLAALAVADLPAAPERAALLAVAARSLADTLEASDALLRSVAHAPHLVTSAIGHDSEVSAIWPALAPGRFYSADRSGRVRLWALGPDTHLDAIGERALYMASPTGTGKAQPFVVAFPWPASSLVEAAIFFPHPNGDGMVYDGPVVTVDLAAADPTGTTLAAPAGRPRLAGPGFLIHQKPDGSLVRQDAPHAAETPVVLPPGVSPALLYAASRDGRVLAAALASGGIVAWNSDTGAILVRESSADSKRMRSVAIDPHGAVMAAGDADGRLRFWNLRTGKENSVTLPKLPLTIWALAFSSTGRLFAAISMEQGHGVSTGNVTNELWTFDVGPAVAYWTQRLPLRPGFMNWPRVLSVLDGQDTVAVGDSAGRVLIIRTGTERSFGRRLAGLTNMVTTIRLTPDGRRVVAGGTDRNVAVWSVPDGRLKNGLYRHPGPIMDAAIVDDEVWTVAYDVSLPRGEAMSMAFRRWAGGEPRQPLDRIAIPDSDYQSGKARIDVEGRRVVAIDKTERLIVAAPSSGVRVVPLPPNLRPEFFLDGDGLYMAGRSLAGGLRLHRLGTNDTIEDLGPLPATLSRSHGPDGLSPSYVVHHGDTVIHADELRVLAWNVRSGRYIDDGLSIGTADNGVMAIAADSVGRWVAGAGHDRAIRLGLLPERVSVGGEIAVHGDPITALALDRSGDRLVSGDNRGHVWTFDLTRTNIERAACRLAGRPMSPGEAARYLPWYATRPCL